MDEKLPFKMENDPLFRLGLAKGLLKAKTKGARNVAIEVAREMKKSNMPTDQIAKFTKLSIEEIENL